MPEEQEKTKPKTTKRQTKKETITPKDEEEEMITEQEPQPEETNKRSTRIRRQVSKEKEEQAQAVVTKPKRKTTKTTQQSEIKLFQNSNSEESMNVESMSAPPIPPIVETKTSRGRPVTKAKQTLRSTSSASNLQVKKPTARSTTQDKENKRTLAKSSSVSNFSKKTSEQITLETSDTKELKSIMKQTKPIDESETDIKNKRAVRILAKIDDKNDQLANLKIDNKTKHSASTSTPSGMRRRPLKAPQDVSMISKS